MKDFVFPVLMLIILALILLRLNTIEQRFDDLGDCIVGSGEAIITELYRYKGE